MFEHFTAEAKAVVCRAEAVSRSYDHNYVGTEHILLALIHDPDVVGTKTLRGLGIDLSTLRLKVEEIISRGDKQSPPKIPFTPRSKKVLEISRREALQLGHRHVSTEHILLGLIREGEGVAAQVLEYYGANAAVVRTCLLTMLSDSDGMPSLTAKADPGPEMKAARSDPERASGSADAGPNVARPESRFISPSTRHLAYLDLDLVIRTTTPGSYGARIIDSPAGQTSEQPFALHWTSVELENFLLRIGHSRRTVRRLDSPQIAAIKEFGSLLYQAVFRGELESALLRSVSEA